MNSKKREEHFLVINIFESWNIISKNQNNRLFAYFETPILPNVRVRGISGRMQARFWRCCGSRIQSSQNLFGKSNRLQIFANFEISALNSHRLPTLWAISAPTHSTNHAVASIQDRGKSHYGIANLVLRHRCLLIYHYHSKPICTTMLSHFSVAHAFPKNTHKNLGQLSNHLENDINVNIKGGKKFYLICFYPQLWSDIEIQPQTLYSMPICNDGRFYSSPCTVGHLMLFQSHFGPADAYRLLLWTIQSHF